MIKTGGQEFARILVERLEQFLKQNPFLTLILQNEYFGTIKSTNWKKLLGFRRKVDYIKIHIILLHTQTFSVWQCKIKCFVENLVIYIFVTRLFENPMCQLLVLYV